MHGAECTHQLRVRLDGIGAQGKALEERQNVKDVRERRKDGELQRLRYVRHEPHGLGLERVEHVRTFAPAKVSDDDQSINKEDASAAEDVGYKAGNISKADKAQTVASVDAEGNALVDKDQQANSDDKARAEAQARDTAKIKAEAASLAAATAAQKLADEKRFQAKQAELKAGKAELVIPAKPTDTASKQQQSSQQQPGSEPKAQSQQPAEKAPQEQAHAHAAAIWNAPLTLDIRTLDYALCCYSF